MWKDPKLPLDLPDMAHEVHEPQGPGSTNFSRLMLAARATRPDFRYDQVSDEIAALKSALEKRSLDTSAASFKAKSSGWAGGELVVSRGFQVQHEVAKINVRCNVQQTVLKSIREDFWFSRVPINLCCYHKNGALVKLFKINIIAALRNAFLSEDELELAPEGTSKGVRDGKKSHGLDKTPGAVLR
ncbi:hypothetical protein J7T55_000063 [Diaporthe amygdali]|uniref:uncharacterized protein n=1 Tax=Phomopsis amygdali TaxID=1214568 RepID=UPI0022FE9912|nr:uncharacterized protein J7T55_000063 [Diaporthe amygdali]KAJ0107801.1 hypothetical protein J7T55_000063 [Diaporthe amygdali]